MFRGTVATHWDDVATDLDFNLVPNPLGGRTHDGFTRGVAGVWPQLVQAFGDFRIDDEPVWFSGHSLGGALAAVAASRLYVERGVVPQGIYTFGQPRTGDYRFCAQFNAFIADRCHRLVNHKDLITCLPPVGPIQRYWHPERAVYIDSAGQVRRRLSPWARFVDEMRASVGHRLKLGIEDLSDHRIAEYVRTLGSSERDP